MKAKLGIVSVLLCVILVVGCVNQKAVRKNDEISIVTMQGMNEHARTAYSQYTSTQIDDALAKMAQVLACLVNSDQKAKEFIGEQIGKKFDDDYDALYEMIADITYNNRTMRGELVRLAKGKDLELNNITRVIPYLNLAIPVNYEEWSSYTGPIYVIPLQYSMDDQLINEYIGYDGDGNSRVFDAHKEPDIPVLVVGINERIEYMEQKEEKRKAAKSAAGILAVDDGATIHTEKLESVYLKTTLDFWPHGNPELYVLVVAGENYIYKKFYYEFADATDTWIPINENMFGYTNLPSNMYYWMQLRDYDGGTSVQYPVSKGFQYNDVNYKITATFSTAAEIGAGDDNFGESLIYYWHAASGASYSIVEGTKTNAYVKVGY